MFSLRRPAQAEVQEQLERARKLTVSYGLDFRTEGGHEQVLCPRGFALDYSRSQIGEGRNTFAVAKEAFLRWLQFDLGWVRVANPDTPVKQDEVVAVEVHTLGLWSLNWSRVLYVIDEEDRFGFVYGTTSMHVERGEERFLVEFYPVSGAVYYDLLAVSQPRHWLARLGYFFTRSRQKKFARDSHRRMRRAIEETVSAAEKGSLASIHNIS